MSLNPVRTGSGTRLQVGGSLVGRGSAVRKPAPGRSGWQVDRVAEGALARSHTGDKRAKRRLHTTFAWAPPLQTSYLVSWSGPS